DFYESNNKMFCIACKTTVNYAKKSVINNHLNLTSHKSKKRLIGASSRNITKQEINIALVKAFAEADILLEKVNKLQTFFKEYCIE
ncbi:10288_t:CDS:1, partial [Racocetra persica]